MYPKNVKVGVQTKTFSRSARSIVLYPDLKMVRGTAIIVMVSWIHLPRNIAPPPKNFGRLPSRRSLTTCMADGVFQERQHSS